MISKSNIEKGVFMMKGKKRWGLIMIKKADDEKKK